MKKTAVALCALMLFLTGCHENNPLYEWKQASDEKKFEAEMTAKAKDFIQWYYDLEKKMSPKMREKWIEIVTNDKTKFKSAQFPLFLNFI